LEIIMEGNAKKLSSIASRTKSLTIRNAQQVDYESLLNFSKLTRLDLNGSAITDQPPLPRLASGLSLLSHLGLANTKIQSLKFASATPSLTSLDISNTSVTDLTPLAYCARLVTLDAGGCRLDNFSALKNLRSLRQLTISPDLFQNRKDLALLKSTAIPFIRTPDDPPNQTAADFFRKYLPANQN